jgi:DNA-nicking Smr family endonuclease
MRRREIVPDANLWETVMQSINPLHRRPRKALSSSPDLKPSAKPASTARPIEKTAPHRSAPPLTGLDRRSEQRMTRGNVEINGRIDLHGIGIAEARERLRRYFERQRGQGSRTVLVITGKGASPFTGHTLHGRHLYHAPEREGRLRRLVPEWLHEPEFRSLVAGFQPAHPKHGGGGAFYVRLRRPRP